MIYFQIFISLKKVRKIILFGFQKDDVLNLVLEYENMTNKNLYENSKGRHNGQNVQKQG